MLLVVPLLSPLLLMLGQHNLDLTLVDMSLYDCLGPLRLSLLPSAARSLHYLFNICLEPLLELRYC